ncbi:MAG: hypothetical protein RL518_2228 [Pseudomonadota bacterium]|jgi:hypothetical protein
MTFEQFLTVCESGSEPRALSSHLKALWFDRRGDWDTAHERIQDDHDRISAAIHAYLHRKEGDISNARYWYSTAHRPVFKGSLDQEWEALAREILALPE